MTELTIINNSQIEIKDNFEQMKEWANGFVEKYKNLLVTEEQTTDIKKEIAELRKISKNINDSRIKISSELKKPADLLKTKADEVISIFEEVISKLDSQVKEFENKEKEEKKAKIESQIKIIIQGYQTPEHFFDRFEIKDKWLNKTTKLSEVTEELNCIAKDIQETIVKQEEFNRICRERTDTISKLNNEQSQLYGFDMGIHELVNSEFSIIEVMDKIKENYKNEDERRKIELQKQKDAIIAKDSGFNLSSSGTTKQEKEIIYEIKFKFNESNQKEIDELLIKIKSLSTGWVKK